MKERLQLIMGRLLLIGLLISLLLTIFGGVFYLFSYGKEINHYHFFQKEPYSLTYHKIWRDIFSFSSYGIIQMGILTLVLTQLLRVILVAWFYFKLHDFKFVSLSLFILAILIYSLFWGL